MYQSDEKKMGISVFGFKLLIRGSGQRPLFVINDATCSIHEKLILDFLNGFPEPICDSLVLI